ncbi:uncharacterized protein METZ01_LOCUS388322, partial [marine metagenome]
VGFFVSRHLGLAWCNIGYMRHLLLLFILTGLLFGQDVLTHKSGKIYKGKYYGIVEQNIVFYVEGETSNKMFPIWEVTSIETSDGAVVPIPTVPIIPKYNLKNQQQKFVNKAGTIFLGALGCSFIFIILMKKYLENLTGTEW